MVLVIQPRHKQHRTLLFQQLLHCHVLHKRYLVTAISLVSIFPEQICHVAERSVVLFCGSSDAVTNGKAIYKLNPKH
jgi:hypothetical protein